MRVLAKLSLLLVVLLLGASFVPLVSLFARPLVVPAALPLLWYVVFTRPERRERELADAAETITSRVHSLTRRAG